MTVNPLDHHFKLTYRLIRADWAAYEHLPRELRPQEKLYFLLPLFAAGMLAGALEEEAAAIIPWPWVAYTVSIGLAVAFAYAVSALRLSWQTRQRIAAHQLPETDTVLDAGPQQVTATVDGQTRQYAWADVAVIHDREHVFLCPTAGDPIVVPLRAFASDADMAVFAQLAEDWGREPEDQDRETGQTVPQS